MRSVIGKLNDGGPLISYTIVVVLLLVIALIVLANLKPERNPKLKSMLVHLGWFALAWGYLGRTFGLIMAFDNVAAAGEITPSLMAGGLKMALIGPLLGLTTFIVARIGLITLTLREKKAER